MKKKLNLEEAFTVIDAGLKRRMDYYNSFIKVEITVDKEKAMGLYKEQYESNKDGMKDGKISYNQWLTIQEMGALNFHTSLY